MEVQGGLHRRIVETTDALVIVTDVEGRITYFNRACEELSGYSRDEVIGTFVWAFLLPERFIQPVKRLFASLVAGDAPSQVESVWLTKEGEERLIVWHHNVIADTQGKATQVVGIGIDITELMEAHEVLRESGEPYPSLVETPGSVVIRVDREGRRTFVTGDTVGLLGQSADELRDGRFGDNEIPEDREKAWALLRNTFETGKSVKGFVTRQKRGEEVTYTSADWEPIKDAEGNVIEIQMTFTTDITNQIEAERRRMQAERLEALANMAGGIAHEVNNVLAMVTLWANIGQMKTDSPEARMAMENVIKAAREGAETMRRLQRFTEPRKPETREPVDLKAIAAECVAFTRPMWKDQSEAKDIYIEVNEKLEEVPEVMGNAAELREAVVYLIQNAIDAMPGGGTLTVRTYREGDRVCVAVSDTGVGIGEDSLTRIFDPLYSTKGGSGLGLTAVRAIVTAHGGRVEVESVQGEGSSFIVSLPIPEQDTREVEGPGQAPRQARLVGGLQYGILVVDDEPLVREALKSVLEQQGHRVATAEEGVAALRAFGERDLDVVFLDLGLPKMNGYRVAEEMKRLKPAVPIILVTGWDDDVAHERIESIGIAAVVAKPFHPQELLRTLEEVMQRDKKRRG
jgi:PAS domain S-box-containing protein